jgi:hypothetical protein
MDWPAFDEGLPHIGEQAAGRASLMEKPKSGGRMKNGKKD